MALYNFEATKSSSSATEILAILSEAIGGRILPASRRALAASDSRSPDEGLALLTSYVAIEDQKVRQAILDAVRAISDGGPSD